MAAIDSRTVGDWIEVIGIPHLDRCLEQQFHPKEGDPDGGHCPRVAAHAKERLVRRLRRCSDAKQKVRYLIVVNLMNGRSAIETAAALEVGRSTVYDAARRFRDRGEAGLIDGREENGERKMDERYLATRTKWCFLSRMSTGGGVRPGPGKCSSKP